jgi:ferric-dicitrate binding protein FerR (iron transport regulator)
MTSSERFDLLLEKYLAGALSRDERQELRQLLRADSGARGEFARILLDESIFRGLHDTGLPAQDPSARPRPSFRPRPSRSRKGQPRQSTSRPWLGVALAALLLMVLGSGTVWLMERPRGGGGSSPIPGSQILVGLPTIAHSHGATIRHDGGPERTLAADDRLDSGDQIRTGEDGSCELGYRDEATRIELSPSTEMTILDPGPGKHFQLSRGGMTARVAPQPDGHPLLVSTPQATVRVIGTRFMLTVVADITRLTVIEGKVHCQAINGQALEVPAGSAATASAGGLQASVMPAQAIPPPSAASPAGFGDWEPLTPTSSLGEWTPFSGDWSCVDSTVIGIMDAHSGRARLDSHGPLPACEISCSIRGIDCSYAEFGVHDYAGSFPIRLGTQQAWHTLHIVVRAATATCEVDGVPVGYEGGKLATGNVGFYGASSVAGARIELSHGRIRK